MKSLIENTPNLRLVQAEICDIETVEKDGKKQVSALVTALGERWECDRAIICSGIYVCQPLHRMLLMLLIPVNQLR